MLKILLQTFLGLLLSCSGVVLFYLYIINLNEGSNIFLFLGAIPLAGAGAFVLYRAGRSDASVTKAKVAMPNLVGKFSESDAESSGLQQRIQKNNALTKEWKQTDDARNRLRMLELSSEANNE